MRRPRVLSGAGLLVGLGLIARFLARDSGPAEGELSVQLAGFTKNPLGAPIAAIAGPGTGIHALFALTNTSKRHFLRFRTAGVDRRDGARWSPMLPDAGWQSVSGTLWPPGFGQVEAVPWPAPLPTNTPWRLQIAVARDLTPLTLGLNSKLGWDLFHPSHEILVLGPETAMPPAFQLLSREPAWQAVLPSPGH